MERNRNRNLNAQELQRLNSAFAAREKQLTETGSRELRLAEQRARVSDEQILALSNELHSAREQVLELGRQLAGLNDELILLRDTSRELEGLRAEAVSLREEKKTLEEKLVDADNCARGVAGALSSIFSLIREANLASDPKDELQSQTIHNLHNWLALFIAQTRARESEMERQIREADVRHSAAVAGFFSEQATRDQAHAASVNKLLDEAQRQARENRLAIETLAREHAATLAAFLAEHATKEQNHVATLEALLAESATKEQNHVATLEALLAESATKEQNHVATLASLQAEARQQLEASQLARDALAREFADERRMYDQKLINARKEMLREIRLQSRLHAEREYAMRNEFADELRTLQIARDVLISREQQLNTAITEKTDVIASLQRNLSDARDELERAKLLVTYLKRSARTQAEHAMQWSKTVRAMQQTRLWRILAPFSRVTLPPDDIRDADDSEVGFGAHIVPSYADLLRQEDVPTVVHSPFSIIDEPSMTEIQHVEQLLDLNDVSFVQAAYQTLLGRSADADGLRFYTHRLRTGIGKGRILAEIAQSEEARKRGISLPGLDALLAAQVNTEGLGLRATAERTVRIERHGNRLENELGRAQERLATLEQAIVAGMPRAEHNFEELRSLVQQHAEQVRGEFERVTELLTEVKKEVLQIRTDRDGSPRMAIDELMAKVTSETERFRA